MASCFAIANRFTYTAPTTQLFRVWWWSSDPATAGAVPRSSPFGGGRRTSCRTFRRPIVKAPQSEIAPAATRTSATPEALPGAVTNGAGTTNAAEARMVPMSIGSASEKTQLPPESSPPPEMAWTGAGPGPYGAGTTWRM